MGLAKKISLNLKIRQELNNYWPFTKHKPWEVAFLHGSLKLSNLLVEAQVSAWDVNPNVIITSIVYNTRVDTDKILINALDAGLNPHIKEHNRHFNTLLHKFAAGNHEKVVRKLIEKGADIEERCGNNYTPICAALNGFGADAGIYKDRSDISKVVDALLEAGADVTKLQGRYKYSIMHFAPMDINIWKKLIKNGAPLNTDEVVGDGRTEPLSCFHKINEIAKEDDMGKWIKYAIECGVDKNTKVMNDNNLFFHFLLTKQEIEPSEIPKLMDLFIKNGFDVEDENETNVFHQIFKSANISNIKNLVNYFINHPKAKHLVDNKNKDGLTPLDMLSTRQDLSNYLLANGEHPIFKDVMVKDMCKERTPSNVFDDCMDIIKTQIILNFKEKMKEDIGNKSNSKTKIRKI